MKGVVDRSVTGCLHRIDPYPPKVSVAINKIVLHPGLEALVVLAIGGGGGKQQ
jgi:hypothetical protein